MKGQVQLEHDGLGDSNSSDEWLASLCPAPQWAFLCGNVGSLLGFVDQFVLIQEDLEWGLVGVKYVPGQGRTLKDIMLQATLTPRLSFLWCHLYPTECSQYQ